MLQLKTLNVNAVHLRIREILMRSPNHKLDAKMRQALAGTLSHHHLTFFAGSTSQGYVGGSRGRGQIPPLFFTQCILFNITVILYQDLYISYRFPAFPSLKFLIGVTIKTDALIHSQTLEHMLSQCLLIQVLILSWSMHFLINKINNDL